VDRFVIVVRFASLSERCGSPDLSRTWDDLPLELVDEDIRQRLRRFLEALVERSEWFEVPTQARQRRTL